MIVISIRKNKDDELSDISEITENGSDDDLTSDFGKKTTSSDIESFNKISNMNKKIKELENKNQELLFIQKSFSNGEEEKNSLILELKSEKDEFERKYEDVNDDFNRMKLEFERMKDLSSKNEEKLFEEQILTKRYLNEINLLKESIHYEDEKNIDILNLKKKIKDVEEVNIKLKIGIPAPFIANEIRRLNGR
jgi:chromosome segregation ATPase